MNLKMIGAAMLLLMLAACSGCAGLSTQQQIGISCETAASALDTLTAAKAAGKVDADQLLDAIRIYESAVVPFCVPVAEDMTAVQRTAFAAAIAELTRRAGENR
jgi:hypothetical protein